MLLFYCKLHKTWCPYQRTEACLQYRDPKTCLDAHVQLVSFSRMLFRRKTKPHIITSISFHKKCPVYAKHIRLTSQVLCKRIVGLWQTDIQSDFVAQTQSLWNTGQTSSPPELPGWSKVTTSYFLCTDQFGSFWLGDVSVWKSCVLNQGIDISYIDHWPRAIYLCDRQTDSQTDKQADT